MRKPMAALISFIILIIVTGIALGASTQLCRIEDQEGSILLITGLPVTEGDMFLAPDNTKYEVISVDGGKAIAKPLQKLDLSDCARNYLETLRTAATPQSNVIAAYHTHSDESYVPNSGKTNDPWNGDIFEVGRRFSTVLRGLGQKVFHSYNRHDPHDGSAYIRSRRTAVELLKKNPAALIDIHRDTPPREVYLGTIEGQNIAKLLLVVGRQNPNMAANEKFAFALKDFSDDHFPDLIRGIYYPRGGYNQDLHPRALLIEAGSTYNSLSEARDGIAFGGLVLSAVLYGTDIEGVDPAKIADEPQKRAGREAQGAWSALLTILILALFGAGLYLLMNERGWQAISDRLGKLFWPKTENRLHPNDDRNNDEPDKDS